MNQRNPNAAKVHFDRAVATLRGGDAAGAERICRRALEQHPRDASLHNLLGAVLMQTGKTDEAVEHLRRATALAPGAVSMHEGLGQALLIQGKFDEGLRSLETARRIEPGRISVLTKMGDMLTRLGRDEDSLRIYRDLVARRPNEVGALQRLGAAAFRLRLYGECEAAVTRVVTLAPGLYEGRMDLGFVQQQLEKLDLAESSFREAARLDPRLGEPHTALGHVLIAAGRLAEAVAEFEQAVVLDPSSVAALNGLGTALEASRDHARAIDTFRRAIALHPQDGISYWSLASIPGFRFEDHELTAMRSQLAGAALPPGQRTHMQFALAKAVDDRGEIDAAFQLYEAANQQRRRQLAYDPDVNRRGNDELIRVFSAEFVRTHAGRGETSAAPIFVVGLTNSGIGLVETLLSRHGDVAGASDRPVLNRLAGQIAPAAAGGRGYPTSAADLTDEQLRDMGARYLGRTQSVHGGKRVFIDSMANNFRHVGLIAAMLPNARIVNITRHPVDVGLDSYRQLYTQDHPYSYDLREIGDFYLQYERLMNHWRDVLPGRVLDVRYEDLVRSPESEVRRLLSHCELAWDDACLQAWPDALAIGRWRDCETQLAPLIDVLEPALRQWPEDAWPASMRTGNAA